LWTGNNGTGKSWSRNNGMCKGWSSYNSAGNRLSSYKSWDAVGDGNWGGNVLNDWSAGNVSMGFRNAVGKVSSETVALDDSRVEGWGTGNNGWSHNIGNENTSVGGSDEAENSNDGLHFDF